MVRVLAAAWNGGDYKNPWLAGFAQRVSILCSHPALPWALLILGSVRGVILLLAYPPAHGADSLAYFAYAEHLAGYHIPLISEVVPPLYPALIFLSHKVLGSIYWLIGVQFVMGASLAPVYYLALKRYNPALALVVALIVLGDVQTGVVFNFTSTEPLYIFLLAITFSLLLRQMDAVRRASPADALSGALLGLLMLTRAVARFLIVPLTVIFWLRTHSIRRSLLMVAGFAAVFALNALITTLIVGEVEGVSASNYAAVNVARGGEGVRIVPENGPNSARYLEIRAACEDKIYVCLEDAAGSWGAAMSIVTGMTLETVAANWQAYLARTWDKTLDFLSLSGQQLGTDPGTPGAIQCADPDRYLNAIDREYLHRTTWAWTIPDMSEEGLAVFRERFRPAYWAMCPALPDSPVLRQVVDAIAFRYRSLGRPQPHLWYGALAVLVLVVPWVRRRYLSVTLTAGVILLNHALISAVIANVQPRYVVVVNPMRVLLLSLLVYIVLKMSLYVLDALLESSRTTAPQPAQPSR